MAMHTHWAQGCGGKANSSGVTPGWKGQGWLPGWVAAPGVEWVGFPGGGSSTATAPRLESGVHGRRGAKARLAP